jgi:mono/diheme cytochrome c family protein
MNPMVRNHLVRVLIVLTIAGAGTVARLKSQAPAVYTVEQAEKGRAGYQAHCATCHAGDLGGRSEAPQLAGPDFFASWRTRTTLDLFQYVQGMPPEGQRLTPDEYLVVTAYILQQNGAAAGPQALTPTTAEPIGTIATGQRPAPSGR